MENIQIQSTVFEDENGIMLHFKLIRNWQRYLIGNGAMYELYQLYDSEWGIKRVDIEESKNLANQMPDLLMLRWGVV